MPGINFCARALRCTLAVRTILLAVRATVIVVLALILSGCSDNLHLSFLDSQGPIATAQRAHFYEALVILLVFVALPVFVLTAFFLWRYRYGAKASAYTPGWRDSVWLEITSWFGPVVIVLMLSYIVWHDAQKLDPYRPLASSQSPLRVQAIGYDWKWLFIYPDLGIASMGVLVLPTGRPIAMQLTSASVMQSLHIPALGSQIYAMGGMVTQLHLQVDKPGRSLGENNIYNGDGFHQQRFIAEAVTPDEFNAWVEKVRTSGIALDNKVMNQISQRGTFADLKAGLATSSFPDGAIYFKGVSSEVFSNVVMATMGHTSSMQTVAPFRMDLESEAVNQGHVNQEHVNQEHDIGVEANQK